MLKVLPLLALTALVFLQDANALIEIPKTIEHNNLESNEIPTTRRRVLHNYVKIIDGPPENVNHKSGSPLILQCDVSGKPAPIVNWLKNGLPITDFEEESNEIFISHPKSIGRMISKLIAPSPSNGDVYTCVASSGIIEKTASTTVYTDEVSEDILTRVLLPPIPTEPVITAFYNDILQEIGTSVTLPCRSYSTTKSQVYWLDNSEKIVYGNEKFKVLPSGDLHIRGLVFKDMGDYTCTVKNMYGTDTVSTFLYPLAP